MLIIHTTKGPIKVALDFENTPMTAENFLNYAKEGFYNGTLFHRVIDGFMVQGGGLLPGMEDKKSKTAPIKNEANKGAKNKRGTLSMARTGDPHSATAQFFINVADNAFLDFKSESTQGWGYCVFGHVVEGMDVVDKISLTQRNSQDQPVQDVVVEKVTISS